MGSVCGWCASEGPLLQLHTAVEDKGTCFGPFYSDGSPIPERGALTVCTLPRDSPLSAIPTYVFQ